MECPFVEVLAAVGQGEHEDNLQYGGGDGKHVTVEGRKADSLECQRKVALNRCRRYVSDETDEVEAPHRAVFPCVDDVSESGRLFERRETLSRIVAEESLRLVSERGGSTDWKIAHVDHDDFLTFGVPWLSPEEAFGPCGRIWEIEIALSRKIRSAPQARNTNRAALTAKPMAKVRRPSSRKSQNHPDFPWTPRI